ncbi:MAG TPA: SDR family NAD(P)-dependent oxidoreductase [Myxococcota bacterium]|nr:SDR family NAD(P)-dependent oxidoreductase [Myxococcota bacterium]
MAESATPPGDPRTVLVTGASSGIGSAIAEAFGALGWRVALGARRLARLEEVAGRVEAAGGKAMAFRCDVSVPSEVEAFFQAAESQLGAIDAAVANAAVAAPGLLQEVAVEDLERELRTNLLHPIVLARRAVPSMIERGRGDVVFVSSESAVGPRPYQVGYSATKSGLEAAARALRMELEGTGVRVAVVRPGPTASEFGQGWVGPRIGRMLASWTRFGLQRHYALLPPESVARAVVAAVTAAPGTQLREIEVTPEAPKEVRKS